MNTIVIELPHANMCSGGITETLKFASELSMFDDNIQIRFTIDIKEKINIPFSYSSGIPDRLFPHCDAAITYSDYHYISQFSKLPQIKHKFVNMLSFGMSPTYEMQNIMTNNVTVLCSTKKIENLISKHNKKVHRIGFGLNMIDMYIDTTIRRDDYMAILYHPNDDKRYNMSVDIANQLYKEKKIKGAITFGVSQGYANTKKPDGLIRHYENANRTQIREIFNSCRCFLMPSITEGLNLTPIEATLCGCPSIIVDGAIGEIYFNEENCFIVPPDDINEIKKYINIIMNGNFSGTFKNKMSDVIKPFVWQNVALRFYDIYYNTI
jgi:glycosyltransferase involved in cell wall biosynthesis